MMIGIGVASLNMADQISDDTTRRIHDLTGLFHKGRLVGSLEELVELLSNPAIDEKSRGITVLTAYSTLCRKLGLDDRAGAIEANLQKLLNGKVDPDPCGIEKAKVAMQNLANQVRQEVTDAITTLTEPEKISVANSQETLRKGRIGSLLKELDINIMARGGAHDRVDPGLVKHFDEKIELIFRSLAQYGIKANTLAEAQQQFQQQLGGEEGETVQDKIRREILGRRRFGAGLEADRVALVKEFPEQEAFINAEYRKEQANLRRSM